MILRRYTEPKVLIIGLLPLLIVIQKQQKTICSSELSLTTHPANLAQAKNTPTFSLGNLQHRQICSLLRPSISISTRSLNKEMTI